MNTNDATSRGYHGQAEWYHEKAKAAEAEHNRTDYLKYMAEACICEIRAARLSSDPETRRDLFRNAAMLALLAGRPDHAQSLESLAAIEEFSSEEINALMRYLK